ncbi:MAG TPA: MBL fold metallo-hydrolase [Bacteroidia bacterium]|jgi:phosphoribosyl 1,2-cyclic phosphate phosphodiesterase|nr:MBL fold metallo-hydrolase [Bacteroidia bacterium]
MKVTFLGTGTSQGVPIIGCKCIVCTSTNPKDNRLRTSVMIEVNDKRFVIDTGPDFRQQMLTEKVDNLTAVIYTHEHRDHVAGMDDLRAFNYVLRRRMDLYATIKTQTSLKEQFSYAFSENKYPGIPEVNLHTIENKPFTIEGVEFKPILVKHMYLDVLGFRIGDFTYITDANAISDEEKKKVTGSQIVVLNALRREPHPSHFTFAEAVQLAQELKCKTTYLTHISHQLGLHDEVEKEMPPAIKLAYDGLSLIL